MLALLCALVATTTYTPTDDIWVYANAGSQEDQYLRVWGSEGKAVTNISEASPASWSLIQFDLKGADASKIKSVHLRLTHIAKTSFTIDDSLAAPVEIRPVKAGFDEKKWTADEAENYLPKVEELEDYGTSSVNPSTDGKPTVVDIDLTKGKQDVVANIKSSIANGGKFAVAVVSKIEIQGSGTSHFYKFYSRSAAEELRPKLVIDYADGSSFGSALKRPVK